VSQEEWKDFVIRYLREVKKKPYNKNEEIKEENEGDVVGEFDEDDISLEEEMEKEFGLKGKINE